MNSITDLEKKLENAKLELKFWESSLKIKKIINIKCLKL